VSLRCPLFPIGGVKSLAGEDMTEPTQFITNKQGETIAVVISIEEYEKLLVELEDAEALREYHEAKASGETAVPLEEALERIERERNRK
jgi:hypothetical protein